jgi:hypothetical protein
MFVISWQGGTTGEVTFGRQTEFTVVCVQSARDEIRVRRGGMGERGVQYASSPSVLCRAARSADS